MSVQEIAASAKAALRHTRQYSAAQRNAALNQIAAQLRAREKEILDANQLDLVAAADDGMGSAMLDRLRLTADRVEAIAVSVEQIAQLPDPLGRTLSGWTLENGLHIEQVSVPLGVIGIIYESRPNVTLEAATLCFKAGNTVVLKGGKEAINSNLILTRIMQDALAHSELDPAAIQLIPDVSRAATTELMQCTDELDVLVPRGGASLIQAVKRDAKVPVIETASGNCHLFVDDSADPEMAINILENAKLQRPSVCNATETLLVGAAIAPSFLPLVAARIGARLEWRMSPEAIRILEKHTAARDLKIEPVTEEDYSTEFNDYILAVRVVADLDTALDHIARYGTGHSEAIVTEDYAQATRFLNEVDAAAVYVNASTRFTDGGQFGFGGELGISTQKLHARGPMGLTALTSYTYRISGSGQIRS